jgi:hypothetical protein
VNPAETYRALADGDAAEFPPEQAYAMEAAGFVGLKLENGRVRAWKGKDGPCWETGRSATYKGGAAAALDDDKHLLFGSMRLCEKTARVYRLPPYQPFVDVTEADPAYANREPVPFDCDTFAADAARLAASLSPARAVERVPVLYPGPFKLLILQDGTILRRGQPALAPAQALLRGGEAVPATEGVEPDNYLAQYKERGALCLLGGLLPPRSRPPRRSMDALADAAEPMRRRLVKLIERKDEYFLLVGSDPADKDGCCPSDDVGRANALVKAGVLEAWTASAEASCPSTVYAFSGEIASRGERPAFVRNDKLRAEVQEFIRSKKGIPARLAVRLSLIAVLLAGAALGLWALLKEVLTK